MSLADLISSRVTLAVDQFSDYQASSEAIPPLKMGVTSVLRRLQKLTPYNRLGDKLIGVFGFYVSTNRRTTPHALKLLSSVDGMFHSQ